MRWKKIKPLLKKIPYSEMVKLGWISEAKNPAEKVINLRKYFRVVNFKSIENMQLSKIAFRRTAETEKSNITLLVWAQKAKIDSRLIETSAINLRKSKRILPDIRSMTTMSPNDFCLKLIKMLADCGICLIFLPHIGGFFYMVPLCRMEIK